MSMVVTTAALAAAAGVGYVAGRTRPIDRLDNALWWRIRVGPREGARPLGWPDALGFIVLHPIRFARAHPKSPIYRAPKPTPTISVDEIFRRTEHTGPRATDPNSIPEGTQP